jgi:hypothetical protein
VDAAAEGFEFLADGGGDEALVEGVHGVAFGAKEAGGGEAAAAQAADEDGGGGEGTHGRKDFSNKRNKTRNKFFKDDKFQI